MDGLEKITKARILLQKSRPFYSYISMYLRPARRDDIGTIGIDKNGNLVYNEDFLRDKTDLEMQGIICHEIGHLIYEHTERRGSRDKEWYNVAGDVVINELLWKDGITLPKGSVSRDDFKELMYHNDIHSLTTEQVYDNIYKKSKKPPQALCKLIEGGKKDIKKGMKEAIGSGKTGKKGKGEAVEGEKEEKTESGSEPDWKQIVSEAITFAKMRGTVPAGMDRQVGELLNEKFDWKALLYKYIVSEIPVDYTYSKPSKRSQTLGYYIPTVKKEAIEVVVSIDTSGSISQKDLDAFMGEIVGIAKSFNNLRMTLVICDCQVKADYELTNGNLDRVKDIRLYGGGGTSHKPVFDWVQEKKPNAKFIICFTDGQTDFPDSETIRTLWVLTHDTDVPFGEKIILDA